ncbi:MAG TPA: DUF6445 family protein [Rhizomicrobium sp.]|nr:DUF6445 family protein [Rhizomicrobium sp.]
MTDLNGKLGLHPRFRHEIVRVGREGAPVVVIDDFLGDPWIVVDYVASQSVFLPGDAAYPGVRAIVPPIYAHALRLLLGKLIRDAFGFGTDRIARGSCGFSLVTTRPADLAPIQRLPHCDSADPRQLALLHYLCAPGKGGTAFYRHRRTGFEQVDGSRVAAYRQAMSADLAELGPPPPCYANGSDARYERIAAFEPVFNRVLIYRGMSLHSAAIAPDFDFDPDPRTGRLTANALLTFA